MANDINIAIEELEEESDTDSDVRRTSRKKSPADKFSVSDFFYAYEKFFRTSC